MAGPELPDRSVDALIVGQGLAGSLLAHELLIRGWSVHVLDQRRPGTASTVAAGLINPITGRRYLKSWRFDELLPVARATYRALERVLGVQLFHPMPLLRAWFTPRQENDWLSRTADPAYAAYIAEQTDLGPYAQHLQPARGYGAIRLAARVDLARLVDRYRQYLRSHGWLTQGAFDHSVLLRPADYVRYGPLRARRLIFCEGWRGAANPLFQHLPFHGDKGDVLLVRFPEVTFDRVVKHKVFIVPLADGSYWVGATYRRSFDDPGPRPDGKAALLERLRQTVTCRFELLAHRAAVRPTVADRRPMLGVHPDHPSVYLFNGLGTKGASLGPYWAQHLARHLTEGTPIDPEVDLQRFGRAGNR